jgi:hypothetical protein
MSRTEFTIAHISDLHFSEGTDKSNPSHCHSIEHLIGLEKRLPPSGELDLLVVSGDISESGDRQSLVTASGYIFATFLSVKGIHRAQVSCLQNRHCSRKSRCMECRPVGVFAGKTTEVARELQFCLSQPPDTREPWVALPVVGEKWGRNLSRVCRLMLLGDNENHSGANFRYDQAVAKGNLRLSKLNNCSVGMT